MGNDGFYDLCVHVKDNDTKSLREVLQALCNYGYSTVAINRTVDESIFENLKKKKKKGAESEAGNRDLIPGPANIEDIVKCFEGKLQILSRLTFAFSDSSKTHYLNQSSTLKKYDLYAAMPKTQTALQFVCSQLNVDIITIHPNTTGLKFSRKLYLQAVERGIHFEIQYSNAINSETRSNAFHFARLFYTFGKSKNVFVSSGAKDRSQVRNPYDIINLGNLFGLCEVKVKASIHTQCQSLLQKSEGRRFGKSVFKIQMQDLDEKESIKDEEENVKRRKL